MTDTTTCVFVSLFILFFQTETILETMTSHGVLNESSNGTYQLNSEQRDVDMYGGDEIKPNVSPVDTVSKDGTKIVTDIQLTIQMTVYRILKTWFNDFDVPMNVSDFKRVLKQETEMYPQATTDIIDCATSHIESLTSGHFCLSDKKDSIEKCDD